MKTSLNDRRWQDYVNSTVDLASQPAFQEPCDWIIPLLPLTPEEESEYSAFSMPSQASMEF